MRLQYSKLSTPPSMSNWMGRMVCLSLVLAFSWLARAHVGSPDVFYDGNIGPYPARVTVRMPTVVPGRAEITVRVQTEQPVDVSFLPLFSNTSISNAPPADSGKLIRGETNLYAGDLWLMTFGAYTIQVKLHGAAGDGSVEIPVNSVAISQLPLPSYLTALLVVLGGVLVFGGVAIVVGAARDSVLAPGVAPDTRARAKGWIAGSVTAVILGLALWGGNHWWKVDEMDFRNNLRPGAWPDLKTSVRVAGSQRILDITLGEQDLGKNAVQLVPDHGKLLHFFLIGEGSVNAIGHLHPVRKERNTFQVALPPLPEGRYKVFCDLTLERNGMSFTASDAVQLPPVPAVASAASSTNILEPDPDDSWAVYAASATNQVFHFPGGESVVWEPHGPLKIRQDAGLKFNILDAAGNPVELEPYMGMMSHAAVMRRDEAVFAHLHPSGNYSMAAQMLFQKKIQREGGATTTKDDGMAGMDHSMAGMDHSKMGHMMNHAMGGGSEISLPYEFPTPGDYRIWVQFKTGGKVMTAVFDASVAGR